MVAERSSSQEQVLLNFLRGWTVALFKEHWLVRAGVNNWLFSRWSMHGDSKQGLYCTEPSVCAHWVQLCNRRRSEKVASSNRREPAAVTKNSNEAHVHIQMSEEQLRFALWVWAASQLGLFLVLCYLLEETTTHKTRQLLALIFSDYKENFFQTFSR